MHRRNRDKLDEFDESQTLVYKAAIVLSAMSNFMFIYNERNSPPSASFNFAIISLWSNSITLHKTFSRKKNHTVGYGLTDWIFTPFTHLVSFSRNPVQWFVTQAFGYIGSKVANYLYSSYGKYNQRKLSYTHEMIAAANWLFFRLPGMVIGNHIGNLTQNWWNSTWAKGWQYLSNYFIAKPNYHLATSENEQQPQVVTIKEEKQVRDYSKLDKSGAKYYKHTSDKHHHINHEECTRAQAEEYLNVGNREIEVNTKVKETYKFSGGGKFTATHTEKEWISSNDIPLRTVESERQIVIVNPKPVQAQQSATLTTQINTALLLLLPKHHQTSVAPSVTPTPNVNTNKINDGQYRQALIKRFDNLVKTVDSYTSSSPLIHHGMFSGKQSRHLRAINLAIDNIRMQKCSLSDGLTEIISAAKQMGQNHPILTDANKCKGFIKDNEFKYPIARAI